jgi:hypothetical protein
VVSGRGRQTVELAAGAGALSGPAGSAGELLGRVRQALAGAAGSGDLAKALMETDVLNAQRMG